MRSILTVLAAAALGGSLEAQSQRPAQTRGVALDLVCGPQATLIPPPQTLKVLAGSERVKALFSAGDTVIINAGTSQGIRPGQHFFARRVVEDRFTVRTTEKAPFSIHTAGWLTIRDAQADVSVATIVEACDGIAEGDYLEPLVLPPAAGSLPAGEPDFARPAHVILGDERRQLGGEGTLLVIDRGSDHGLKPGQRLTIFRPTLDGTGPIMTMGEGVVASTQHETSVMRILKSREAIQVGDLVAIHR